MEPNTAQPSRALRAARRMGWLLVALAHVPGLLHAWGGLLAGEPVLEHLGGCVWLTASTVFLALKVLDVAFLRFPTGWRPCMAIALVVALLHVDLIRPGSDPSIVPDCAAVLVTAMVIGTLPPVRRGWNRVLAHAEAVIRRRLPSRVTHETIWLSESRPHCWVAILRLFLLRAPPA